MKKYFLLWLALFSLSAWAQTPTVPPEGTMTPDSLVKKTNQPAPPDSTAQRVDSLRVTSVGNQPAALATGHITGMVLDSAGQGPVEFATVALLGPTSNRPITGTTTDASGHFSFDHVPPGTYRLLISFVGYENQLANVFMVTPVQPDVTLPKLLLRSSHQTLNEVKVTAKRELIEDREDRLVYNAGNDPTNSGGTAIDVMKKVPLLTVDPDGTLTLKGSTSIKVLVNGKPSSIMARSIGEALQMIPADAIKSVEVITAPSAKYDAEGTAGVINIITKSRLQGLMGGLNATTGNRQHNVGANLNMRKDKTALTAYAGANLNQNDGGSYSLRRSLIPTTGSGILEQTSSNRNTGGAGFGSFNLDYDLDSTNQFGLDGSFNSGSRSGSSIRDTRYSTDDARQPFRRYTDSPSGNNSVDGNVNYTRLFKRTDQQFTFLAQANRNKNNSGYSLDQYPLPQTELINYRERNTNLNTTTEVTLQADYAHPFKTGKKTLEVGAKSINRTVASDYRLENATDSTAFQDVPSRANQFNYRQWVGSAYASFRLVTPKKWSYTLGGRYEITHIDANFMSTKTMFASNYRNFLPNITLSKRFGTSQRIRLNYSQRIQRPQIFFLNPYINSTDPKNLSFGNPYLSPELAHSVELTYSTFTKKGLNINALLFARLTNNAIERITTVDTANVSYSTFQNIAKNATYGMNLFAAGRPYKNWQLNGSFGLNYNVLNSVALNIRNTNWNYRVTLNASVPLPQDYSIQANGSYNSPRIQLQGQSSGFYNYVLAFRKEFKPKQVVLTLNLENFLSRYNTIYNEFRTVQFITDGYSYNAYRNIRLSANWRFGKMEAKASRTKKRISNDDGKAE
ncbi:TonB-dependent receptor domain-containing protein [Fibrella aquatilis]|nr:outer membrane beta-barrel family protein [Fibrella aquatilis]